MIERFVVTYIDGLGVSRRQTFKDKKKAQKEYYIKKLLGHTKVKLTEFKLVEVKHD